jgi:hypothetical protein
MNLKRTTTIFALLFLISLITKAQIDKYVKGEAVRIDTAVCMPVATYRNIRGFVSAADLINSSNDALLVNYKTQVSNLSNEVSTLNKRIQYQDYINKQKDSVNLILSNNYKELSDETTKTLEKIAKNEPNKFVFLRKDFWLGAAVGAIITYLVIK